MHESPGGFANELSTHNERKRIGYSRHLSNNNWWCSLAVLQIKYPRKFVESNEIHFEFQDRRRLQRFEDEDIDEVIRIEEVGQVRIT